MDCSQQVKPLWKNLDYLLLWIGQSISALGTGISQVALPILLFLLTGNPAVAGLISSIGQLPSLLFMLLAGPLVDRWDRRRTMLLSTAGLVLCSASVVLVISGHLPPLAQLIAFCLCSFLIGTLSVFYGLAKLSALIQVVSPRQLSQALAQGEAIFSLVSLAAPLGTFLLNLNRIAPFVVDALSYVVLLISLFFMRTPLRGERGNRSPHLLSDMGEGLRWVWRQPAIRFLIALSGYLELIVSVNVVLLTVIAHDEGFSLRFVGIILAMAGVGSLLGAVLSPVLQRYFPVGRFLMWTLPLIVLLWPCYALVRNPWVLGTVVASLALLDSLTYIQTITYLLAVVPNRLQGRVNSIARLVFFACLSFGPLGVGLGLRYVGTLFTVGIVWAGSFPFALLALFHPRYRQTSLPKKQ